MTSPIGARLPRVDALPKATGAARFLDDLGFAGMLHAAVVRSPHPHARVLAIDPAPVLARPGVAAVALARDIPGRNVVHIVLDDQPLLADGRVRYAAEPVALVAAETREAALAAAAALRVEYEPLPPLLDLRESRTSPLRIFGDDNTFSHHRIRRGDAARGLAESDVIVEGEYRTGYQEHAYLEPQGMIAVPEGDGGMTVYGSMQCPFYVQVAVADTLGLGKNRVRVVQTVTGGAFGGKEDVPSLVAAQAALLAHRTGRPVKLVYSREEDVACTSKRHPAWIRAKLGAARDGTLRAAEVEFLLDGGAYATLSPVVLWRAVVHAVGPYRCPNAAVDGYAVATHRVPCGAFRGFGSPQVLFAAESQLDRLAEKLGLDPAELRRRNLLRTGDTTITGQRLDSGAGGLETLERALERARWNERPPRVDGALRRGRGVATIFYGSGLGAGGKRLDRSDAFVQIHEDGTVTAAVGTTEMGQGMNTVLTQVVAAELGVKPDRVRLLQPDTSRVPDSGPTVASRATVSSGNALRDACAPLRDTLRRTAAGRLGVPVETVRLEDGAASAGGASLPLEDVVGDCAAQRLALASMGHRTAGPTSWDAATGQGDAYVTYAWATVVADVAVDTGTGRVAVERLVAAHDVGKALNPAGVEAQIEGGSVQGAGYAVWEELLAPAGVILNPSLSNYTIPTAVDAPRVEPVVVEAPYPDGPHGAKGFAEQPLMGIAPAVANAVHDALGLRFTELPLSPERVLAALEGRPTPFVRSCGSAPAPTARPSGALPDGPELEITATVNGVARTLRVGPGETLLHALRERLRLTGAKEGCGKGECGACTVLLDRRPVNACLVLAAEIDGRSVTTIEGLGEPALHPLQRAFVNEGAVQCGFCTPGLILSAAALLEADPDPGEGDIRRALAGNLCRCTGYERVVRAVQAAAAVRKGGA